ncbi:type IV pilus twitching motility protein PilT [Erwinia sp. V71]|uniref:type IV pilus twitching motility protein PilT n=1 Tax=Erwinia sp. V71 TaxID=3369424 RepID=UPI003F641ACC
MDLDEIVALSVKHNAADLHLCSGHLPQWRCHGRLSVIPNLAEVNADVLESLVMSWLDHAQREAFAATGHVDFALTLTSGARLRANAFHQRLGISLALRLIASDCPPLAALGLPEVIPALLQQQDGLLLISGATGSGKSTTLAAMIGMLNQQRDLHIITLEDPVEFIHHSQQSLIQQREIGQHCSSFQQGLRAALREDPDVILLGELRDSETIRLALTAAETGHLVLATLHTRGAAQAIDRLVDVFLAAEKNLVRCQLAGSLKAVVAQQLVAGKQGGRVALFEVLVNTPAVANLIREGKNHQLPGLLQTGIQAGMRTFEQSYRQRVAEGVIAEGECALP